LDHDLVVTHNGIFETGKTHMKHEADVEFSRNAIRQFRDDPTYNERVERVAREMMDRGIQIEHIGNDLDDANTAIPGSYVIDYDSGEIAHITVTDEGVSVTY
jgi:hypothetical protein